MNNFNDRTRYQEQRGFEQARAAFEASQDPRWREYLNNARRGQASARARAEFARQQQVERAKERLRKQKKDKGCLIMKKIEGVWVCECSKQF
jgi:hypothetical protein